MADIGLRRSFLHLVLHPPRLRKCIWPDYLLLIERGRETYCYGQSAMIDPIGKVVAKANGDEETVLSYEADLEDVVITRQLLPLFRARRPYLYTLITEEDPSRY